MRKITLGTIILLCSVLMLSCKSAKSVVTFENADREFNFEASGLSTPIAADITVQPNKIIHQETFELNKMLKLGGGYSGYCQTTMGKALMKHNADLLIAPLYEVTVAGDGSEVTIKVSGYPANYVNFRKASKEDLNLIEDGKKVGEKAPVIINNNVDMK